MQDSEPVAGLERARQFHSGNDGIGPEHRAVLLEVKRQRPPRVILHDDAWTAAGCDVRVEYLDDIRVPRQLGHRSLLTQEASATRGIESEESTFTATVRSSTDWKQRYTVPKPPRPITSARSRPSSSSSASSVRFLAARCVPSGSGSAMWPVDY